MMITMLSTEDLKSALEQLASWECESKVPSTLGVNLPQQPVSFKCRSVRGHWNMFCPQINLLLEVGV